ncbi:MAG TPA: chemotaxis protein CheB, partial [Vicinamibacterales bacterium]|nr:chemotaxis protein CheB [Vicinamibacterales bacterium]
MSLTTVPHIVVGASAGGTEALRVLLSGVPDNLPAAVLVVVHRSPQSPRVLEDLLASVSALPMPEPVDGAPIQAGHAYVAPADRHLMIESGRIRLSRGPKENHSRPAVDVLFRSAAAHVGPNAIGVVLT